VSRRRDGTYRYDGRWRVVRQRVLQRDDHLCRLRYPGCEIDAVEVDHVIPVEMGGAVLDSDNCRSVCAVCHRRRSNAMRQRARQSRPSQAWPRGSDAGEDAPPDDLVVIA
jgi:5-methylcytosine-specific restriction endonuclease McrA